MTKYSQPSKLKSDRELALETIDGKYGHGELRKELLGSRYNRVQRIINEMMIDGYKKNDENDILANWDDF